MIVRDPARLKAMERFLYWYAETRPHQVKRLSFGPLGKWAVGPTEEGRVRWLFEDEWDYSRFCKAYRGHLLIAGYLGPLETETRVFK
jgi:hypothetical protein